MFRVGWRRLAVTAPHESPASKVDDVGQMRPFYTTILFLAGGGLMLIGALLINDRNLHYGLMRVYKLSQSLFVFVTANFI